MEVSHTEFQENPRYSLWDAWKNPFMALWKIDFVLGQHDWKPELTNTVWWKSSTLHFIKAGKMIVWFTEKHI
jgi:hypothetical protein